MYERIGQYLNRIGVPCRTDAPIAPYTTFRIGGNVSLLIEPETEQQLICALRAVRRADARVLLLGRGSNVLFPDGCAEAAVIRTAALRTVGINETDITAACGATMNEIVCCARDAGLSGLEFSYGIPGTLGGALCMNAGAYGGQMSDVVTSVRVYDAEQDKVLALPATQMNYAYRHSVLLSAPHLTALGATMTLRRDDADAIDARMQEHMRQRREKQPLEYPSAGSVFKRPAGYFAGALIEQSGLKGYRIGGAMVSPKHAGFIVNVGDATAHDVLLLIQHIKDTVARDHGVELETEIQILTSLGAK